MKNMSNVVKVIECPRDAWQGMPRIIPAETKATYLRELIDAGFQHIDAVSFVSPKAVPQMADSEEVLRLLQAPEEIEIIGIVVNEKGAERAVATESVRTLGFPYSIRRASLSAINIKVRKSLSTRWTTLRKWPIALGSTWLCTFRWPSEIHTANRGVWRKWSRRVDCCWKWAWSRSLWPIQLGWLAPKRFVR